MVGIYTYINYLMTKLETYICIYTLNIHNDCNIDIGLEAQVT